MTMLATGFRVGNHVRVSLAVSFASPAVPGSPAAFGRWLTSTGVEPSVAGALALRLGEFRQLHGAVTAALDAAMAGAAPPPDAVARLNEASALVPFAPRLAVVDGRAVAAEDPRPGDRANDVLAAVARSAIRLIGSDRARRVRRCPACRSYFLASRPDRIWCGAACGNRARAARHHARRRAGERGGDGP